MRPYTYEAMSEAPYIPALRFHFLTRFYDGVMRTLMKDGKLKRRTVAAVGPRGGERILDLGCGTGTLAVMLKVASPESEIVGLDADPAALALAREKAESAGVSVAWQQGMVFEPPIEAGAFDVVVSSMVFHHLTTEQKRATASATGRILRPGGRFVLTDFTKPANAVLRATFGLVRRLDSVETTEDNAHGRIGSLLADAGFTQVLELHRENTTFGTVAILLANRGGVSSEEEPRVSTADSAP